MTLNTWKKQIHSLVVVVVMVVVAGPLVIGCASHTAAPDGSSGGKGGGGVSGGAKGGTTGTVDGGGGDAPSGPGGQGGSPTGGSGGAIDAKDATGASDSTDATDATGATDAANDADAGGSPAAALDGWRIECPCQPNTPVVNQNCNQTPQTERQTIVKTMGGDPGTTYDVTLRVRGLTEPCIYGGGTAGTGAASHFYTGGTTTTPDWSSYMMTVGTPAQHYFFNANGSTGHVHLVLDYQVTVKIRGGSKVTFDVDGDSSVPDGHELSNFDHTVVPGVPPAPSWYDGQFIQLDVVSVSP